MSYGILFGCFPSIIAETFGVNGLATNWGCAVLSPVTFGNLFNIYYGMVYDSNSVIEDNGDRQCAKGLECYRSAYVLTTIASIGGLLMTLWTIRFQHELRKMEESKEVED